MKLGLENNTMENQVVLSEKSWSYKLLKFIFRINPKQITNFCPYFWLTVAGLILFPFFLAFWVVMWPIRKLKRVIEKSNYTRFLKSLRNSQLYYLKYHPICKGEVHYYFRLSLYDFHRKEDSEILKDALKLRGISEEKVDSYKRDFEEENDKTLRKIEKYNKILGKISTITKYIFSAIMFMWIIFIGYVFSTAIVDLIYFLGNSIGIKFFGGLLILISSFIVSISYAWICSKALNLLESRESLTGRKYLYAIPAWIISSPFIIVYFLLKGIVKFGGIFGEYLKASYKDYCPGINWKEIKK